MAYGTALKQSSSILFGSAAAMAVVAGGLVVTYLALPHGAKVAPVAVAEPEFGSATPKPDTTALTEQLGRTVTLRLPSPSLSLDPLPQNPTPLR